MGNDDLMMGDNHHHMECVRTRAGGDENNDNDNDSDGMGLTIND